MTTLLGYKTGGIQKIDYTVDKNMGQLKCSYIAGRNGKGTNSLEKSWQKSHHQVGTGITWND